MLAPVAFRPLRGAVVLESVVGVEATFHLDHFQVFVGVGLAPDAPAEHLPSLALVAVLLAVCVDLLHSAMRCEATPGGSSTAWCAQSPAASSPSAPRGLTSCPGPVRRGRHGRRRRDTRHGLSGWRLSRTGSSWRAPA